MPDEIPVLAAARALVDEIDHFKQATDKLDGLQLRSKKHLERAGRLLQEIADSEDKIGDCLRGLNQQLGEAHGVHATHALHAQDRALEIQKRTHEYEALMKRFILIGAEASALNEMMGRQPDLVDLDRRVTAVLESAEAVYTDARAQDFTDVATDADSMRQQLQAVRAKLRKVLE